MDRAASKVILRPERVAVVRRGHAPEMLGDVAVIGVQGGERLPKDKRFSFGFKSPKVVGIITRAGTRRRVNDAAALLLHGGREIDRSQSGELDPNLPEHIRNILEPHDGERGILAVPGGAARWDDEMDDYLKRLEMLSFPQEDGSVLDDFEKYQIMHAKTQEAVQENQPFIRGLPPSALGQIIGNRHLVKADGNLVVMLQWLGDVVETTALAFSVGIQPPSQVDRNITGVYRPFAVAQFGTLGALEEMEIDVGFGGTQFTVCGNVATIRMGMDVPGIVPVGSQVVPGVTGPAVFQYPVSDASYTPLTPGSNAGVPQLNMYGMISFNTAQRATPLTRTRYIDNLPDAGFVTFTVPKFSTQLFPPIFIKHGTTTLGGTLTLIFLDFQGNAIGLVQAATQTLIMAPVPVPGDAAFVKVINQTGGGSAVDGRLVFALQL